MNIIFFRKRNFYMLFYNHLPVLLFCVLVLASCGVKNKNGILTQNQPDSDTSILQLADPTIFFHEGTCYLYGTGGNVNNGFMVYTSNNLKSWSGPAGTSGGNALVQGNAYGTKGFWAPQVFYRNNQFYMAYTANENIAIAQSSSPLGPFVQPLLPS